MSVRRVAESPRVTKPYSEEAWARIEALGHTVDAHIQRGDMRLTMGGEPTFVSVDDRDGAAWNTDALDPPSADKRRSKRALGAALLQRMKAKYAPQGLLHFGQGKWYPGESLPRWAFTCYWRTDGVPLWRNPELLANVDGGDRFDKDRKSTRLNSSH